MKTTRLVPALAFAALLAGCAAEPLRRVELLAPADREQELSAAFAPGASILSGIDPVESRQSWRAGDRVLFGVRLVDGGKSDVWFVLIELLSDVVTARNVDVVPGEDGSAPTVVVCEPGAETPRGATRLVAPRWSSRFRLRDEAGRTRVVAIDSRNIVVRIQVFDGSARVSGEPAMTLAPEAFLREGLIEHVVAMTALYGDLPAGTRIPLSRMTDAQIARAVRSAASVFALGRTLWFAPELTAIIQGMIAKPSIFSLIVNLGVRFSVDLQAQLSTPDDAAAARTLGGGRAYRVPLEVRINREPALRTELLAVEPLPPFQLSAGIIGLEATHLADPQRTLVARLLAARRSRE